MTRPQAAAEKGGLRLAGCFAGWLVRTRNLAGASAWIPAAHIVS